MVIRIRHYRPGDAAEVGRLIARTYEGFNLGFAAPGERAALLGPFRFARSDDPAHRAAIADAISAPLVLVATDDGSVVGVLRGGRVDRRGRAVLQSLFVDGRHHRRGIGRRLVERFERSCADRGIAVIRVASTLHAVPFYEALGYRRSTGRRTLGGFDGGRLPYQPMRKRIVR